MWTIILNALIKELQTNPDRIITIIENIIGLFKSHPAALDAAISMIPKPK